MAIQLSGGRLKGRSITAPKGTQTRPTSTQVRAALFNILGQDCSGWRVLDLFAGSGAMGFEALSRGAQEVLFVDHHRLAVAALRQNIQQLGVSEQTKVFPLSVSQAVRRCRSLAPFDLIIADPPYDLMIDGHYAGLWLIQELEKAPLLAKGGILIVEGASPPEQTLFSTLKLREVRRYGDTYLWILENPQIGE
jgi:16S rRNA (guanine966-N2)-methyltransferase